VLLQTIGLVGAPNKNFEIKKTTFWQCLQERIREKIFGTPNIIVLITFFTLRLSKYSCLNAFDVNKIGNNYGLDI